MGTMPINRNLSYAGCCRMIKAIPKAKTADEMYERCGIADAWLKANAVLTDEQYHNLLYAVCLLTEAADRRKGGEKI